MDQVEKSDLFKQAFAIRRKKAETSAYVFALTYLSDRLKFEPSPAHIKTYDEITSIIHERGGKYAFAGPRGFGKTEVITETSALYGICYGLEKFIVIISGTEEQSVAILSNIKKELTENERIRADFPEIFEQNGMPKPPRWTRHDIITRNGIEVLALSCNQKIRGRKHESCRPTMIILDDVENSDNTFTSEARMNVRDWHTREVMKAGDETTNFFFVGNKLHQDCLLAEYLDLAKHPSWIKRSYPAITSDPARIDLWEDWSKIFNCQKDFLEQKGPEAARMFYEANKAAMDEGARTLWPQRWAYYDLRVTYEEDPMSFNCEMMNQPFDPNKSLFNVDAFHWWNKTYRAYEELVKAFPKFKFFAGCDPSMGGPGLGDYSAIVVLAKDPDTKTMFVVLADIRRRQPHEIVSDIATYQTRFNCEKFGYEANGFQRALIAQIEEEGKKRGIRIPLQPITHSKDKVSRIQSLAPWIRNGTIQFHQEHRLLLEQLRDFPYGKFDDGPDALEVAVELAQKPKGVPMAFVIDGRPGVPRRNGYEDWGPFNRALRGW